MEQTEFTSSAEISSDWLPRVQAEELRSPFPSLVGSSHNQVVERARKTFLCLRDEGFGGKATWPFTSSGMNELHSLQSHPETSQFFTNLAGQQPEDGG